MCNDPVRLLLGYDDLTAQSDSQNLLKIDLNEIMTFRVCVGLSGGSRSNVLINLIADAANDNHICATLPLPLLPLHCSSLDSSGSLTMNSFYAPFGFVCSELYCVSADYCQRKLRVKALRFNHSLTGYKGVY